MSSRAGSDGFRWKVALQPSAQVSSRTPARVSVKAATVSGCILQGAAVIGYLLAEGLADAANREVDQ